MFVNKHEIKKRLTIVLWLVISSFLLWLMSMVDMQSFDETSYVRFSSFLFGAGVAYHFLTVMLGTPITPKNTKNWDSFIKYMLYSAFAVLGVVGIAYFEKYLQHFYAIPTLVSMFIALIFVSSFAEKARKSFLELKSKEPINRSSRRRRRRVAVAELSRWRRKGG